MDSQVAHQDKHRADTGEKLILVSQDVAREIVEMAAAPAMSGFKHPRQCAILVRRSACQCKGRRFHVEIDTDAYPAVQWASVNRTHFSSLLDPWTLSQR